MSLVNPKRRRTLDEVCTQWALRSPTSVAASPSTKVPIAPKLHVLKTKTEMCRHRFKPNHDLKMCTFAHSVEELRQIPKPIAYKTVPCRNFWGPNGEVIGKCPFGTKCRFAHYKCLSDGSYLKQKAGKKFKTMTCKFKTRDKCPFDNRCTYKHTDDDEADEGHDDMPFLFLPSGLLFETI
jgi:hypothetical protein